MPKNFLAGFNLSDYGLPSESDSSALSPRVSLQDLLSNRVTEEAVRTKGLEKEISQARSEPTEGFLGQLKDPQTLLRILAAGIAATQGGGGQALGAGLAIGGIKGAEAKAAAEEQTKDEHIANLEKQLEDSRTRLDKAQTRIASVYSSAPESFETPEGATPDQIEDARVLGWYMTGADIPIFPSTKRVRDRRHEQWQKRVEMLSTGIENSTDPALTRVLVDQLVKTIDWTDAPDEVRKALAGSIGTEDFDHTFAATLMNYGGSTALDAIIYAGENKLPLHHPEVLRHIRFQDASREPSQQLNARLLALLDELNTWQSDPANQTIVNKIKADATDEEEATEAMISQAFGNRNADIAFLKDRVNLPGNWSLSSVLQAFAMVSSKEKLVDTILSLKGVDEVQKGKTPEQVQQDRGRRTTDLLNSMDEIQKENKAMQYSRMRNNIVGQLYEAYPGLGNQTAYKVADNVMAAALEDAESPEQIDALILEYTKQAVQQLKAQQAE